MDSERLYTSLIRNILPRSEIELRGEIPNETIEKYRNKALKKLAAEAEISGFRKGHVPESVIIQRMGEIKILEEAVHEIMPVLYPQIVDDEKLNVIAQPKISITKLAPGNPVSFSIQATVYPDISLPDYKEASKNALGNMKDDSTEVSDKELEDTIFKIRKGHTQTKPKDDKKTDGESGKDAEPPELTEDLVQSWNFKNITDFREKLRGDLAKQKEARVKEKRRIAITDAIIGKMRVDVPNILIEIELNKMLAEFKANIERMGLSIEEYLKKIEKTEESLRSEWKTDAEKRAKLHLALNEIAKKEGINPDKESVEIEVKHILSHVKDADVDRARNYATEHLRIEKVFEFLESQH